MKLVFRTQYVASFGSVLMLILWLQRIFEDKYILEGRGFQRQGGDLLRFSKAGVKTRHDLWTGTRSSFFIDHLVSVFCGYWGVRLIWYRSSIIQPRFEVHCPWKMDSKECDSFWFCKLVWHPFTAKKQSCVTSKIKQFGNKSWSSNSSNGSKNQEN